MRIEAVKKGRVIEAFVFLVIVTMFYTVIYGFSNMKSNLMFGGWAFAMVCLMVFRPFATWERDRLCRVLSLTLFLGANVLWVLLACGNNYHYDEAYTLGMIARDWREIVEITAQDVHSPFYYFALKLFCLLFGAKWLQLTKFFSLVLLDIALLVGRSTVLKLYGEEVACFWMLFGCFAPSVMVQSTSPRMYSMGFLFVTLSGIYALACYRQGGKKNWIAFTIFSVCGVYVHTFSMIELFFLYVFFLTVAFARRDFKKGIAILISGLVVCLCYLPWLIVLFHQFLRWTGAEAGWGNTLLPLSGGTVWTYLSEWFSALETPSVLQTLFGVGVFLFTGYFAIGYVKKTKDPIPVIGLGLATVVLLVAVWISLGIIPCFLGRYLFPLFGMIWLFMAVGMQTIREEWIKIGIALCILLSGLGTFRSEKQLENSQGLQACKAFLEEYDSKTDAMMADNYFLLMMSVYYPEERFFLYGPIQAFIPFGNVEGFTQWEQLGEAESVWYFRFAERRVGDLNERYQVVETVPFHYSYYDIIVEHYVRKDLLESE